MPIEVPTEKPARPARDPERPFRKLTGWHNGTVERVTHDEETGAHTIRWRFTANRRTIRVDQRPDAKQLAGTLVDLGFAGRTVELAEIKNARAGIFVQTSGGGRSARVDDTKPLAS